VEEVLEVTNEEKLNAPVEEILDVPAEVKLDLPLMRILRPRTLMLKLIPLLSGRS
jgi:hypothetical protein